MKKKEITLKYYEFKLIDIILFNYIFFNLLKNSSLWSNEEYIGYDYKQKYRGWAKQFFEKTWSIQKIPPKFLIYVKSFFSIHGIFFQKKTEIDQENKKKQSYTFIILNELLTKTNKSLDGDVYVGIFYSLIYFPDNNAKKDKNILTIPLNNNNNLLFEKKKLYPHFSFSCKVIIKVVPLKNDFIKNTNNLFERFNELKLLKLNNELTNNNICPFFIKVYNYFIANMKQDYYENPNIKKYFYNRKKIKKLESKINILKKALISIDQTESYKKYKTAINNNLYKKKKVLNDLKSEFKNFGKKGLFILMESGEFNLKDYFQTHFIYDDIVYQLVFQILIACYCQSKYNKIIHFDLHGSNILINLTNIVDYNFANYSFKIKNKKYTTNNLGLEIKLIDYGRSYILNNDNKNIIYKKIIKQGQRFFPKKFNSKNIKKILTNLKTKSGLSNYIYSFDLWRISSYLLILIKSLNMEQNLLKSNHLLNKIKKETEKKWINELIDPSPGKIPKNYHQSIELLENLFYTKKQFRKKISQSIYIKSFNLDKKNIK